MPPGADQNIAALKALLHGAIFHATCLAMMICAALQLQGEGCYTLQRVYAFFPKKLVDCCNAHAFAVVVMETLRNKLLRGCYTMQRENTFLQSLQKVESDSTLRNDWCNLSRNDFDHCTACYTV